MGWIFIDLETTQKFVCNYNQLQPNPHAFSLQSDKLVCALEFNGSDD